MTDTDARAVLDSAVGVAPPIEVASCATLAGVASDSAMHRPATEEARLVGDLL